MPTLPFLILAAGAVAAFAIVGIAVVAHFSLALTAVGVLLIVGAIVCVVVEEVQAGREFRALDKVSRP